MGKYLLIIILLSGCYTQQKAVRSVHRAIINYPDTTQRILRNWRPCITTAADTVTRVDSIVDIISVQCPDEVRTITDTITGETKTVRYPVFVKAEALRINHRTTYTIRIKDMADVKAAEAERDEAIEAGKRAKWWNKVLAGLSGLLLLILLIFKRRK